MAAKRTKLANVVAEKDTRGFCNVVFEMSDGTRHAVYTIPFSLAEDIDNPEGYLAEDIAFEMAANAAELARTAILLSR